jgi:hypothetical protein
MSSVSPPDAKRLLRDAIALMSQHNWQLKVHLEDMAQFEKQRRADSCVSSLLILFLPIIGVLLVCLQIAQAKKEHVTFQVESPDLLNATSSQGTFRVQDQAHLLRIAKMVPDGGASYVGAILLALVSLVGWSVILPIF